MAKVNTYYLFKRVDKYDVKLIAELEGTKEQADQLLELMSKMNKSLYVSFEIDREEYEVLPEEIKCKLHTIKLIKSEDYLGLPIVEV